jgi:hypothetical protein
MDRSKLIGVVTLDSAGHAVFTTSALAVDVHLIDAAYIGEERFLNSTLPRTSLTKRADPRPASDRPAGAGLAVDPAAECGRRVDAPKQEGSPSMTRRHWDGGPDCLAVKFMQIFQGRVHDPDAVKATLDRWQQWWQEMESRPDVIGATIAIDQDGFFPETVAFTSEEAAREAESMSLLDNVEYLDLHQPWFDSHRQRRTAMTTSAPRDDKLDFFDFPHTNTQTPAVGI